MPSCVPFSLNTNFVNELAKHMTNHSRKCLKLSEQMIATYSKGKKKYGYTEACDFPLNRFLIFSISFLFQTLFYMNCNITCSTVHFKLYG